MASLPKKAAQDFEKQTRALSDIQVEQGKQLKAAQKHFDFLEKEGIAYDRNMLTTEEGRKQKEKVEQIQKRIFEIK